MTLIVFNWLILLMVRSRCSLYLTLWIMSGWKNVSRSLNGIVYVVVNQASNVKLSCWGLHFGFSCGWVSNDQKRSWSEGLSVPRERGSMSWVGDCSRSQSLGMGFSTGKSMQISMRKSFIRWSWVDALCLFLCQVVSIFVLGSRHGRAKPCQGM